MTEGLGVACTKGRGESISCDKREDCYSSGDNCLAVLAVSGVVSQLRAESKIPRVVRLLGRHFALSFILCRLLIALLILASYRSRFP